MAALCLFLAAIGAQLVPLPQTIVARLSPDRDTVPYEQLLAIADSRDPQLVPQVPASAPRAISIAPTRTWIGLAFVAALGFFVLGASRGFTVNGTTPLVSALAILGVVVAFVLFLQKASGTSEVYGWFHLISGAHRSAPFGNRNHEAGWLVMVLCLAVGRFAGQVARGMRGVEPRWRDRLLWFSSNQANRTMLLAFAIGIIALAVFVSQSRSGAAALAISLSLFAWWNAKRQRSVVQGVVLVAALATVAAVAFSVGGGAVSDRITGTSWATLDGRLEVWLDSVRIAKDFWLTGTGFNTYGVAMLHYQTVNDGFRYIEAHNDYLQLAVEGGLLVGIPALILMASVATEISRRFREGRDDTRTYWVRVGAVCGIAAIAAQSLVDFTLQMSGAAVMFATLLAIAMHHPPPRAARHERHAD